jgi:acid stress-induced BolA-like protein IbaG/YrbA
MAKITETKLKEVLTKRLRLKNPRFELERLSKDKLSGSVISDTFSRMKAIDRQKKIWDALEAEFGPQASSLVGTLLAYTDAEWDVDLAEC